MKLKILLLLVLLCGSSLGQTLTCEYTNIMVEGETTYGCYLTIVNPEGRDDFQSIGGTHMEGRTDADVVTILRNLFASDTTIFPQILCSTFQNLETVDFSWLNVEQLNENTFSACRNLEWIRFWLNEIETVHERAFVNNRNLRYIDLDDNNIQVIPENVFNGLINLEGLELSYNPLESVPATLFTGLTNLRRLILVENEIEEINQQWFISLENLETLSLYSNKITELDDTTFATLRNLITLDISQNPIESISNGVFRQQTNLEALYMAGIGITQITRQWFESLRNLEHLFINSNDFRLIEEGAFDGLDKLLTLDISGSHLSDTGIPGNLFQNMPDLLFLDLSYNLIQNMNSQWFQNTTEIVVLDLNFNQILSLPRGVFASIAELMELDLWANLIKTVNRDAFGNIHNLLYVDFDNNVINAIEEIFLQDAEPLFSLYLSGNLCTSERFYNFAENRATFIGRLALCTRNHRFIVETETEAGADYAFFEGNEPGIQLRVNTDSSITIALSSFDVVWNPMIEIRIGVNNNTLSQIVRNQEQVVVTVPTPNILRNGGFTGFRITWSHHVILVTREDQFYPFMAYTMEDWFAVNYYGLQSENDAAWTVQPVEAEIAPTKIPKALES